MTEREVDDIWMKATRGQNSIQQESARKIQLTALPRLIGNRTTFSRASLLEKLVLEVDLQRGLRLLLLCVGLFCVVIYLNIFAIKNDVQLGLLSIFSEVV